jgi:hypothetical protein
MTADRSVPSLRSRLSGVGAAALAAFPCAAHAMSGALADSVAGVMAIIVLLVVPAGLLYLFWMVHILPEKLAEKRGHPQKDAIHMLCLLSLAFGGLLWPFAFLWAYSKPVVHKLAYGTDKHEDHPEHPDHPDYVAPVRARAAAGGGAIQQQDVARLREELDALEKRGPLPAELVAMRSQLRDLEWRWAVATPVSGGSNPKGTGHA